VDQFYPRIGIALLKILRRVGVEVHFPEEQTCCGQPAFNNGYWQEAKRVARHFLNTFDQAEAIIIPSGSCTSMIKVFYPLLFEDDPPLLKKAQAVAAKAYEFSYYLVNILGIEGLGSAYERTVTYHDSCHLRRELGIVDEPRKLISSVKGLRLIEMVESERCCGFGGLFSLKNPELSQSILQDKLNNIKATGAEAVVAADVGCLLHMAGAFSRQDLNIETLHLIELLAAGLDGDQYP